MVFAGLFSLFLLNFAFIWKNPNPLCWFRPVRCSPKPQHPVQRGRVGGMVASKSSSWFSALLPSTKQTRFGVEFTFNSTAREECDCSSHACSPAGTTALPVCECWTQRTNGKSCLKQILQTLFLCTLICFHLCVANTELQKDFIESGQYRGRWNLEWVAMKCCMKGKPVMTCL